MYTVSHAKVYILKMRIKMHQNIFFIHHFFEQTPWQILAGLLVINVRMQNELLYVKVGGPLPPL